MPTYSHRCNCCKNEWEEFYSMKEDPPTVCPSCKTEGKVQRLISLSAGPGIVRLTGHEHKAHLRSEGAKMAKEMANNENMRANFMGEDNYHQSQLANSKLEEKLINIGKDAPKSELSKGMVKRRNVKK